MNDKARIEKVLKMLRDISLQNPNFDITANNVYYNYLTSLGLPKKEINKTINNNFNEWVNHFAKNPKCRVFVSDNWKYFCQFVSNDMQARRASEHIKVYIPLDSKHIKLGAEKIFEFLSQNNISHVSKIGSHVRFDDIVIRLINPDDLVKLINFVSSDNYIQKGLLPANPFLYTINGIALASDGRISINMTIANLISLYIKDCKEKNQLYNVSVDDFYHFITKYRNEVFSSSRGYSKFINDFISVLGKFNDSDIKDLLINYQNVFDLIIKCKNPNFEFREYLSHYLQCTNAYVKKQKEILIDSMDLTEVSIDKTGINKIINEVKSQLLHCVDVMLKHFNNDSRCLGHIEEYVRTGNPNYITTDSNLRDKLEQSNFRKNILIVLNHYKMDFNSFLTNLLNSKNQGNNNLINNEKLESIIEKKVTLTIKKILAIMSVKYGYDMSIKNLKKYIETGKAEYLTRDNNLRKEITTSNFRIDLENVLKARNCSLTDYLNEVLNNKLDNDDSEIYLENAILETYQKYEEQYQNGQMQISGMNAACEGLKRLITKHDYHGFTRRNEARKNLMSNVSFEVALEIIKQKLNVNDISFGNLDMLIEQYVSDVVKKNCITK